MAFVPGHKHDLFVSYAHAEAAWVEQFTKALCKEFHERSGEPLTLWQDSKKLRAGQNWTVEIQEGIRRAAAFLAIVSPSYLKSHWCRRERGIVLENRLEALKIESFYRFLKIIKRPELDNAHETLLGELEHFRFFDEADRYEFPAASAEFTSRIREAVRHVWELLRLMRNRGQKLYLAPGSIDMAQQRDELERELKDRGFNVKPDVLLGAEFGKEPIRKAMDQSSLVIFIVGDSIEEDTTLEIEVAEELGKPVAFWVQPGKSQKEIVDRIDALGVLPAGSEVLGGRSIRELIPLILEKLRPKREADLVAPTSGVARIYLNYDFTLPEESRVGVQIADLVREREFEVLQSGRDTDHDGLMRTCNAVLLLRTANPHPDEWLKHNAMELAVPAQALERSAEFDARALLVTEPARIRSRVPGVPVYAWSEPFFPETLDPFFETLRKGRAS